MLALVLGAGFGCLLGPLFVQESEELSSLDGMVLGAVIGALVGLILYNCI